MTYEEIGKHIGALVDTKNKQYGDAFSKTGDFLEILYPTGIEVEDYDNVLALVRIFDKMMRIANGNQGDENAWNDLAGYGILMADDLIKVSIKSNPQIAIRSENFKPEVSI